MQGKSFAGHRRRDRQQPDPGGGLDLGVAGDELSGER
jgi:hypothetical protein